MAGSVWTCSVADRQHDYYKISQAEPENYTVSLTIDPTTPLYRIVTCRNPDDSTDIRLFEAAFGSGLPVAAVHTNKNWKKGQPLAVVCTSSPPLANCSVA